MLSAPQASAASSLRLLDRLGGLKQVVDAGHRRQVDRADIVADELAKGEIHADALNVTRRVERQHAGVDVVEQRLKVRGLMLIQRSCQHFEAEAIEHAEILGVAAASRREVIAEDDAARAAAHAEILQTL